MRGEFPQNIERALERLWQSAAKTVPGIFGRPGSNIVIPSRTAAMA